jgi:hypothetical protein
MRWLPVIAILMGCKEYSLAGDMAGDMAFGQGGDTDAPVPGTLTAGAWDDNRNFDLFERYLADSTELSGPTFTVEERAVARDAFAGDRASKQRLDVAVVLDTTGSMSDEHAWLSEEIQGIAGRIDEVAPDADVRWALVVYRDHGDDYVSRASDFTGDLGAFAEDVARQGAGGGGDTPEAVEEGLKDAVRLDWRTDGDVARLAFWIADAPAHDNDSDKVRDRVREVRDAGIHLYPIAASGIDPAAERAMRASAQLTGGRYLFLTDDSGVGEAHAEPTVPCYFVTTLSDAVVRMVNVELSGRYLEPEAAEVIRTGGDPTDGRCTLADGSIAVAF